MAEDKFKQLELLVSQTASRLRDLQGELTAARQKIRAQENVIERLRESETELKTLREWKKNTVNTSLGIAHEDNEAVKKVITINV